MTGTPLLLDTHVLLWWLGDDAQLSTEARATIGDSSVPVYVSAASLWEAEIKAALGRLELDDVDLTDEVSANGFFELPIRGRYTRTAADLPQHHSDPFDRMLIAQAMHEGLRLVTADQRILKYDVALIAT